MFMYLITKSASRSEALFVWNFVVVLYLEEVKGTNVRALPRFVPRPVRPIR